MVEDHGGFSGSEFYVDIQSPGETLFRGVFPFVTGKLHYIWCRVEDTRFRCDSTEYGDLQILLSEEVESDH